MTESDWATSPSPQEMLSFLRDRGPLSERKLRLFAAGCCRRVWHTLPDVSRTATEVAERHADGRASINELREVHGAAESAAWDTFNAAWAESDPVGDVEPEDDLGNLRLEAAAALFAGAEVSSTEPGDLREIAVYCLLSFAHAACPLTAIEAMMEQWRGRSPERMAMYDNERAGQAALVRCIFGSPFRPVSFSPEWRTEAVVSLARSIYEERAWDRMSVLGDALEEAGCSEPDVLQHCRGAERAPTRVLAHRQGVAEDLSRRGLKVVRGKPFERRRRHPSDGRTGLCGTAVAHDESASQLVRPVTGAPTMSAAAADARLHTLLLIELLATLSYGDEDDENLDGPARATA